MILDPIVDLRPTTCPACQTTTAIVQHVGIIDDMHHDTWCDVCGDVTATAPCDCPRRGGGPRLRSLLRRLVAHT